jgi:hypothetical protein
VVARLAPRTGADITGTLPEFEIVGYQGGWFQVTGATYGDYGDPPPRRPLYSGKGWLPGASIGGMVFPGNFPPQGGGGMTSLVGRQQGGERRAGRKGSSGRLPVSLLTLVFLSGFVRVSVFGPPSWAA